MSVSNAPTDPAKNALYWAAVAVGLKEAQERDHGPLSPEHLANFEQFQNLARSYGYTDGDIRAYQLLELG